ncbi:hypothetical protein RB195_017232 [Necator americanus]|uniref:7TM GPCR serpentine receptor class x (Srx) domain-containing protein n=1 Tax=Necator americanus TaxID=51031 RepID=A0ABR1C498_NECAM
MRSESDPINDTLSQEHSLRMLYLIDAILALIAFVPSILFVTTILYFRSFRREYPLLILLSSGEAVACISHIIMGFTSWTCFLYGFDFLRMGSCVMTPLSALALATDRFICVAFPGMYRRNPMGRKYCFAAAVILATMPEVNIIGIDENAKMGLEQPSITVAVQSTYVNKGGSSSFSRSGGTIDAITQRGKGQPTRRLNNSAIPKHFSTKEADAFQANIDIAAPKSEEC